MEKNLTSENISMYIKWRDEFLTILSEDFCKKCNDPRKNNITINYESPLECECRCDRVEIVLSSAANIDTAIKALMHP